MRKTIVIAVREYTAAVKTKAFIISLVVLPVFYLGMFGIQFYLKDKVDTSDKKVCVVDQTGQLFDFLAAQAEERNESAIFEERDGERVQVRPRFLVSEYNGDKEDPQQIDVELSERVRKKELLAYLVIGPDVPDVQADPEKAAIRYHSNSPTFEDFLNWARATISQKVQSIRFAELQLDPTVVGQATRPVQMRNLGLVSVDETGQVQEAEETNRVANFLMPAGMMMLMFMVIMIGASPLVQSVLEEKMGRIAEVLLGCVSPFQLMLGKLLGMVGVSLTISTLYLIGAALALRQAGYWDLFPTHVVWWFVLFQALAVLMFGSAFVAIGAAVTDAKEAQSVVTPVMIVVVLPMLVWVNVIKEPNSTLSLLMSLFPPATPMLMLLRQSVPPGVPLWQPLLGTALVILTTLCCVFAAGRIFRVGLLMQGRGAKVGEMLRWVIKG